VSEPKFSHGWMADTHPEALRVFLKIQGRMTAEQKLRRVVEMYETMTAAQMAEVRRLHPEAGDREVFLRVTARRLGPELMKKVYGWPSGD
jgi:hypothetical protein